jgi:hypothetical protein
MTDYSQLEKYLSIFEPEEHLPRFVQSVRDLYNERFILRSLPCTDFVLQYVAGLVLVASKNQQRFRALDCLRVIRYIIRGTSPTPILSVDTIDLLFSLYQRFIFSPNEEIQWCVSIFIKDRPLRDSQLSWLAENAESSVHLVNRLLRYPEPHPILTDWALSAYQSGAMPERTAEILGLLIEDMIPSFAAHEPSDTLVWAIYYSRTPLRTKEAILLTVVNGDCIPSALDVALRLRLPRVVRRLCEVAP